MPGCWGYRFADYGLRPVRPGAAALVALRSGYHLAHGAVRRRLRAVSVADNHTIVASAPSHRSGGASGMLGTARLLGQSTGAALVALLFNLLGNNGTHTALLLAGTLLSSPR